MEHQSRLLPTIALGLMAASAIAQSPENPPPWWGVQDNVTVSLSWTFDTAFPNGQPDPVPAFAVTPAWYNNPSPWTASSNVSWIANLGGQQGVCGLVGNGTATLDLFVDNDPHLDWVKIFFFQFDTFEGASGEITSTIQESLQDYGRAAVTEKTQSLGNGWERTTVTAELIPQPDDEEIDFVLLETLGGTIGIDNLHVCSKCEKPRPDEMGDALGKVLGVNSLSTATGGRQAGSLAVTRGNAANPGRKLWLSVDGFTPSSPFEIIQLGPLGLPTGIVSTMQISGQQAPLGPLDMDVERIRTGPNSWQEWVYVLIDSRPSGGSIRIEALDANTSATVPSQSVQLQTSPFTASQRMSLAFDPSGDTGAGTFWVAGQTTTTGTWRAVEFDRTGAPTNAALSSFDVPAETAGMTYDATLGNFYCFSSNTKISPSGIPIRSNGSEISGFNGQPTGVQFCGDLTLQPIPGAPPGGIARALSMYRTFNGLRSQIQFLCIADVGAEQFLYELAGPFRYGYSRYGTCGMQNGPPFLGGSFDVTLSGVPNSLFAVMFMGSSFDNLPLSPGIQAESVASILPPLASSGLLTPVSTGEFSLSIALPPNAALAYKETFFQWIVLDTTAPGFLGFSQAGKTVIYP